MKMRWLCLLVFVLTLVIIAIVAACNWQDLTQFPSLYYKTEAVDADEVNEVKPVDDTFDPEEVAAMTHLLNNVTGEGLLGLDARRLLRRLEEVKGRGELEALKEAVERLLEDVQEEEALQDDMRTMREDIVELVLSEDYKAAGSLTLNLTADSLVRHVTRLIYNQSESEDNYIMTILYARNIPSTRRAFLAYKATYEEVMNKNKTEVDEADIDKSLSILEDLAEYVQKKPWYTRNKEEDVGDKKENKKQTNKELVDVLVDKANKTVFEETFQLLVRKIPDELRASNETKALCVRIYHYSYDLYENIVDSTTRELIDRIPNSSRMIIYFYDIYLSSLGHTLFRGKTDEELKETLALIKQNKASLILH